ncbi:hypothetical protein LXD69_14415 [Flavobacterium sediminilitoris]|uniref:Uncharacterized protein n=1 Tax=Flavobacterium sediminilitoris TaxID=2024526 RepID=A0ABY4HLM1_9FLAO|nr:MULTISPECIES: hypothetical protein [Flavobacterium]UOX33227.1 hypothetical protein LXD69_14415 [Flavobacterium sediminilitoris]
MGFFKKIGKGIGKFAKKNLNFKTLVKVGSMVDPTGLVGGLQGAHYAAKEQREYEKQLAAEQLAANQEVMNSLIKINPQTTSIVQAQKNINIKDVLTGAAGGALNGAGEVLAGTSQVGNVGAAVADSTIKAWFKKRWYWVVGGLGVLTGVVILIVKLAKPKRNRGYRR